MSKLTVRNQLVTHSLAICTTALEKVKVKVGQGGHKVGEKI